MSKITFLVGAVAGAIGGFLLWNFQVFSNSIFFTNPYSSAGYGIVFGLLLSISVPALAQKLQNTSAMYQTISGQQFQQKAQEGNTIILDVRTRAEVQGGYIPNARNLDIMSADFDKEIAKLDKTKQYLVYCRSGNRSGQACNRMSQLGFANLYNLQGGIGSWQGKLSR